MSNQIIGFRATPERREKLLALAQGESVTVTEVINRLIDSAQVKPVQRVATGLALVGVSYPTESLTHESRLQVN